MKGRGQGKAIKGSGKAGKGVKGKGGKGRSNGKEGMKVEGRSRTQVVESEVESCDESSFESSSSGSGSMSESDFEYEPEPEVHPAMQYSAVCSDDVSQCYSRGDEVRKAQRKARRKKKIDQKVFCGGKVKEVGIVIASFKSKKKAMNVNCPVETLGPLGVGPSIWSYSSTEEGSEPGVGRFKNTYNTKTTCGTRGITRKTLVQYLEGPCVDEDEFKKVFLMYVLSVLCSSTCHRMKKQFLHGVSVADNAPLYNWCEFVLDELMKALGQFSKRFYGDDLNFNASSGGCTLFLAVLNALKSVLNVELDVEPDEEEVDTNPKNVKRRRMATTDRPVWSCPKFWRRLLQLPNLSNPKVMENLAQVENVQTNDADTSVDLQKTINQVENVVKEFNSNSLKKDFYQVQSEEILSNSDIDVNSLVWTVTQSVGGPFNEEQGLDQQGGVDKEHVVDKGEGEHKEKEINEERLSKEEGEQKEINEHTSLERDKEYTREVLNKEKEIEKEKEKEKVKEKEKEKKNEEKKNEKEHDKEIDKEIEKEKDKENEKVNEVNEKEKETEKEKENVKEKENEKVNEKENDLENDLENEKETDKQNEKVNEKEEEKDKEKDQSGKAELKGGQEKRLENRNGPEISDDVELREITFESEDEPVTPLKLRAAAQKEMLRRKTERSRRQRKMIGVQTLPMDYVTHWRPKYIRTFREPLLKYVMDNSSGRLRSLE
uniref:Uncharacterized protein n=1 Tax=Chenopodium quinoa TaxID=63459 RepID=A0A803MUB9_CHEQI